MPHLIRTPADWLAFAPALESEPVVACYIQASGNDPLRHEVLRIALATRENGAILHVPALGGIAVVKDLLSRLMSGEKHVKVFHNAKAAIRFLLPHGLAPTRIFDTMLADQLLAAGEMTREPELPDLAQRYLGVELPPAPAHPDDDQALTAYAQVLYNLRLRLIPLLVRAELVRCAQIEFECTVPTAAMENAGMRLDTARLRALIESGERRMEECTVRFARAFSAAPDTLFGGTQLNLHSDQQLLAFLQERGLKIQRVNRSTLKPLVKQYPGLQHLLDYRQAASDRALTAYLEAVHPATGRIHPTYSQLAASTGRFGCSNPNMQSFPRSPEHRSCIVPAPGKALVVADYSQIELRIAAQISQDRRMLDAFRGGGDLHTLTASILTGKPTSQVTKAERQAAKAVNFGLIYSMGARGLAAYAEQTYNVEMSLEEAERFRARYFSAYTGVQAWHNRVRREKPTHVRTLSGRLRRVPEGLLAQALNSPVQGTGADILKRALVLLYPAIWPLGAEIIGVVHDEILVEAPLTQAAYVARSVSTIMERAAGEFLTDVPCPVDAQVASSWAEKG